MPQKLKKRPLTVATWDGQKRPTPGVTGFRPTAESRPVMSGRGPLPRSPALQREVVPISNQKFGIDGRPGPFRLRGRETGACAGARLCSQAHKQNAPGLGGTASPQKRLGA